MAYAPCKNPHCKSFGKPHPNCRCYGEMAEGGDAAFCSAERKHNHECEYFADGGPVMFDDMEEDKPEGPMFDDMVEDEPSAAASAIPPEPKPAAASAANEDLSPADLQAKMISAANPQGAGKYESPGQQLATVGEGLARGVAGELATYGETKLGVPLEDIRGRQKANPGEAIGSEAAGFAGSMATGIGEFGAAAKLAQGAAEYARLGKVGAGVLKGAFANGLMSTTDNFSQMMMGENPEHPVGSLIASVGLGGLLGGVGGKASSIATDKLSGLAEKKYGTKIASFLAGVGSGVGPEEEKLPAKLLNMVDKDQFSEETFESGRKAINYMMSKASALSKPVTIGSAAAWGFHENGLKGAAERAGEAFIVGKLGKWAVKAANKIGTPVVLKILSNNTTAGMLEALDHAEQVQKGVNMIDRAIEGTFNGTGALNEKAANRYKDIEKWMEGGGADQDVQEHLYEQNAPAPAQGFAKGGDVKAPAPLVNGVATHFPEQNMLMNTVKGRASAYLNTLRPATEHHPKLAFDDVPDDTEQKRSYKSAIKVAANPLSIMDDIRKGTILPENIKHLNAMFPEVTSMLQKGITERIIKAQLKGEKPSFKVRQGMSMLLGTPLSGEVSPQNISAAQAVFAPKPQPGKSDGQASKEPAGQSTAKTRSLSKSDRSFLTDAQARVSRGQRDS